jgi:hypothetical protein
VIYQFRYIHIFWLVAVAYRNEFLLVCDECGRGIAANPAEKGQVFRELDAALALPPGPLHLLSGQTGFLVVLVPGVGHVALLHRRRRAYPA